MPTFFRRHARSFPVSIARQRGALSRPATALIALIVLAGAAVAVTYLFLNRGPMPVVAASAPPAPAPIFVKLEPFTVSITNQSIDRLLYVGLTLRMTDERSRGRLEQFLPEVRSQLLVLLSEQDPDAMQTAAGKRELAGAIRQILNGNGYAVIDVLYTAFVVQ